MLFLILFSENATAQAQLSSLTVEKIMRDPKWIGTSPSTLRWSENSKLVYFNWNPDANPGDSLYAYSLKSKLAEKVDAATRRGLPSASGVYNRKYTKKVYIRNGDIFILDIPTGTKLQLTNTLDAVISAEFSFDETQVLYVSRNNLFSHHLSTGVIKQLTDFKKGKSEEKSSSDKQDEWLKEDQLRLFSVLKERKEKAELTKSGKENDKPKRPKTIYTGTRNVSNIKLSPDGRFITYSLTQSSGVSKNAKVPSYVTESGYTEELSTRAKVGSTQALTDFWIYNIEKDTAYPVITSNIPGIKDRPDYVKEYPELINKEAKDRDVLITAPKWSEDGKHAFVIVRSHDNKDRWIMLLDPEMGTLKNLDRQRDEAWIAGPGIGYKFSEGNAGWMPDNKRVWFQSEESGYSHLYAVNVITGEKTALTTGKSEIYDAFISRDKKHWYFTSNEVHPGELHFYKMPVEGGKTIKLTSMTGQNEVWLSPDEKYLAIRHSYSNKPWEMYIQENKPGAKPVQVTQSLTQEFRSYPWKDPEIISFKASDGQEIYARIYEPEGSAKNHAAVIFVHGAGYLQNAHKGWSTYFREYMFHNLLADEGYTVLDIDYRASAGYGRDVRTGIYRHMGGKDLSDHVDGARLLVEKYGIDPERIGIYGGSYGGFITLMALFTEPDVFAAGAALRSVTDWAHYNHLYTTNILNEPVNDSLAYVRSSPIYHAEGLKGHLLICHGMIDTNVHFQDVVRLAQRLIELGKDNWEMAVYPLEDHAFVEPSSWTDEYKRVKKLFDSTIKIKPAISLIEED